MDLSCSKSPAAPPPFRYEGPADLQGPVVAALTRVIDPEVALSIVDVGLIHDVSIAAGRARVTMTMTSPACPVADLIVEEVESELALVLPAGCAIEVVLVWEPPWTPGMMSARSRRFMRW